MQQAVEDVTPGSVTRILAEPVELDRISIPFLRVQERKWLLGAVDGLLVAGWMWLAYIIWRFINPESAYFRTVPWNWVIGAAAVWLAVSWLAGAYDLATADRLTRAVRLVLSITLVAWGGALLAMFLFLKTYPRPGLVLAAVAVPGTIAAWRAVYALFLRRPASAMRTIVVGPEPMYRDLCEAAARQGEYYRVLGFVDTADRQSPGWLGSVGDLASLVSMLRPHRVAVAPSRMLPDELVAALGRSVEQGVEVVDFATAYEDIAEKVAVEHVGDSWVTSLPMKPRGTSVEEIAIRLVDIVGSIAGLVLTALLAPAIAASIVLDSGRPLFYRQERLGLGGRRFTILKFRSMRTDAERATERWASPADARATRIGRFLRRTHLDELPQFWNVLKGEMSLVGPRPERPGFTDDLAESIPFYRLRLAVRPGLTGLKQIRVGYAATLDEHLEVLRHDLYYIKHRSLVFNLFIIGRTVARVFGMKGR